MNLIKNLVMAYRNHKKEKYNARYAFVYKHAFNQFYKKYKHEIPQGLTDLPDFYYKNEALEKAKAETERFMAKVVMANSLNREYLRILGI